jgi:hypothetical protein
VNLLVLPDNAAGLACWQALGCLPGPGVLCTEPLGESVTGQVRIDAGATLCGCE